MKMVKSIQASKEKLTFTNPDVKANMNTFYSQIKRGNIIALAVLFVLIVLVLLFSPISCTRISPGYVGVRVKLYGTDRGVDDVTMVTGRVWYNPWLEEIHPFPTFLQQAAWTKDINEGSPTDESISFNSSEGASFNADIFVSYQFLPEAVSEIFKELRQDADLITKVYVRSKVRGAFDKEAAKFKAIEILGDKKAELLAKVKGVLQEELKDRFIFDSIEFIGRPRVDQNVEASINATITATQEAIKAENRVRQFEAEAKQQVEKAKGEATMKTTLAEAEAEANRKITESITPTLLQYKAMDKWDGKLPMVYGESGGLPLIPLEFKQAKQ